MQNVVGPTLVAVATIFALGAESNRLPACHSVCYNATVLVCCEVPSDRNVCVGVYMLMQLDYRRHVK